MLEDGLYTVPNYMTFQKVLDKYRKISFSERDKGDRFERLMQAYLKTDPKYAYLFKKVWLWNEFSGREDLGGGDTGIDLVALTFDGDYWAIQCKCFQEKTVIDKPAVDSFLSTSSRKFKVEGKSTGFSNRLWISTTNNWGPNATESIKNQHPPVTRLNLFDLQEAPVDWEKLDQGISGEQSRITNRELRLHQVEALERTHKHFKKFDRGKLIMACGTGKTFNALRIAEHETKGKGNILFLVPSIALLGQTLREWTAFAKEPISAICICSDPEVSKKKTKNDDSDNFSVVDLALPASTDVKDIVGQFQHIKKNGHKGLTVVFSTYQSIEVISKAQKALEKSDVGIEQFDLVVCDEAHRTTGVTISGEDESAFTKVHDNKFLKAKKRLYMTATPRLYSDDAKSKAAQADAILCSMDDVAMFGEEIYRIGFGDAVEKNLLTDYKVLILTLSDKDVPPAVQKMIADEKSEITTDDASKLIGCINALSKQILGDQGIIKDSDPEPMRRAVAFCQSISVSRKITSIFNTATDAYISSLPEEKKEQMVSTGSKHIDGTMSAPQRDELLGWLKQDTEDGECRVLTNVRCLSEGVDVPSLDAVMFLSARNSQVDVVQSVGRVMRKAPGKKYGYIIIPVVVPANVEPDKALDDNERYKVVWTVLNALRAHDDRFNATVNKIELNRRRPSQILVGRPEYSFDNHGLPVVADEQAGYGNKDITQQLALQFEQLQNVVFARMVQKVGDKRYWEQWAKSVAEIAQRHEERINRLITENRKYKQAFEKFLTGLQKNINPNITGKDAIEMLSQHLVTAPVFEALFEGYSFVKNNPISKAMQSMLELLEEQALEKDTQSLEKFYASVRKRAEGIDNSEGKQRIILELYEKYFKTALPKMVDRLGIVYTPVEVVDFIVHSVNDVLKKEFGRSIGDENIHILDPFTGTGTFVTRLIQSGLIDKKNLTHKYKNEIHANEIVLLAYYIAAVNIENAYHDAIGETSYTAFEGICLTDTFQLGETDDGEKLFSEMFPQNSARVQRQKKAPLRVIMGNPPYSAGQKSVNDDAQNQDYARLDSRIETTYAAESGANLKNSLYDSYIKAFRWSTDRLDPKHGGIICFVSNGSWIDGNAHDGFRKCIEKEFSSVYVFNLRGNQRTSGELSRKEGGKIFGSGSRTPIAITLLVKNPKSNLKATVNYCDIGDYLSREDKLGIIKKYRSVGNSELKWTILNTNPQGDWINQRNNSFEQFIALGDKDNPAKEKFFNAFYSRGVSTSRDAWMYNYSNAELLKNIKRTINFYNEQRKSFHSKGKSKNDINDFINKDSTKIVWTDTVIRDADKNIEYQVKKCKDIGLYRPYQKQFFYYEKKLIHRTYLMPRLYPKADTNNILICVSGVGSNKDFTALATNLIPSLDTIEKSQCFPLFYFEDRPAHSKGLFDDENESSVKRDGISDYIVDLAKKQYGKNIIKEDIFYYVYGFLHSLEYRETFANDLKKMLPRLPLVEDVGDFWAFSKAGRKLADLHINYESVEPHPTTRVVLPVIQYQMDAYEFYSVEKIRFPKKDQKDTILYNSRIKIENIPAKAYEYVVNGKSAIEWIMERYQITVHKESGIKNDPNEWSREVEKPTYILDLLLSIVNVSVQTVDIVAGLPKVKFE
jgi:predicted helicase